MDYDISLLQLEKKLGFGPSILPIGLVSLHDKIETDTVFTVTGWGTLEEGGELPRQLQVVNVPYVDNKECQVSYQDAVVTQRMICAGTYSGDKDSCQVTHVFFFLKQN